MPPNYRTIKLDETKEQIDLKKILFLLMQQKDINNFNNISEPKNFIISTETLKIYKQKYNIVSIYDYMNSYIKNVSLNKHFDWDNTIEEIKNYCNVYQNIEANRKEKIEISKEIEYYKSNNIKFPINFSLIESKFYSSFNDLSNQKKQNELPTTKIGYIIKIPSKKDKEKLITYILLNYYDRPKDDVYFAISLNDFDFTVEHIFIVGKNIKVEYFIDLAKENIELKQNMINENNIVMNINKEIKMICYPNNIGCDDYIFNKEIYNKILYCFSIDKIYNQFILSFNSMKNYQLKEKEINITHVEKIILNEKKLLEENLVFLIDENTIKNKILDDYFYYFNYITYSTSLKNEKDKILLIEDIFDKEISKDKKENNNVINNELKNLMKSITYDEIINNNNDKTISLISPDIYQKILKLPFIDYMNIETNLIKINNEFYIYFNKIKKLAKLKQKENPHVSHDFNIWTLFLFNEKTQNNNNNNKQKVTKNFNISQNIIKKIFLISQQSTEIKNNIGEDTITEITNYYLINRKWLEKYKEHYQYLQVIKNLTEISVGDNYNELKKNLDSLDCKLFEKKIVDKNIGTFPDELKNPDLVFPKMEKYKSYEFPYNFDIINKDLFHLLIKEEDPNDNYNINVEINIKKQKKYKILLGKEFIILIEEIKNNILLYSLESQNNKKIYQPKYVLNFNNSNLLQEQTRSIKKMKSFEDYISKLGINIKNDSKQSLKYNNVQIGHFSFLKMILSIKSYEYPPLIGLENVGATCYMNATLQCFSNIDLLTDFFFEYGNNILYTRKNYTLVDEYIKLLLNLWNKNINKNKKYYAPNDFKKRIGEKNPLFKGIAANDSKDLILFILEELHNDLNHPEKKEQINKNINSSINPNPIYDENNNNNSNNIMNFNQNDEKILYKEFIDDYNEKNNSIIKDIFYGVQESITVCLNCKIKLPSFSIINFLIFPLEKVRQYLLINNIQSPYVTLEHCFQHYISPENLFGQNKMYCNNCKGEYDAQTYNIIYRHQKVLIIILNRGKGIEFNVPFTYPIKFELNKYINMNNNPNYENVDINKKIEYELISVITHMGESGMSGHFIACAKSPVDNNWYMYNDAIVSVCDNPLNVFGSATTSSIPYVLFYQLKEDN